MTDTTNRPEAQGMEPAEALATIADHLDKDTYGFVLGPDGSGVGPYCRTWRDSRRPYPITQARRAGRV